MGGTNPDEQPTPTVSVTRSVGIQVGDGNFQHNNITHLVVESEVLPAPHTIDPPLGVHNLPRPATGIFLGRDGVLAEVTAKLADGPGVIVYGLGGSGKSELVSRYAHACDEYTLRWWINAETPEQIALGLAELTRRLHPFATLADAEAWALGWLQSHADWLLILDNVDDPAHVKGLLGQLTGHGHIVITTRRDLNNTVWGLGLAPLQLPVLEQSVGTHLLIQLTNRPGEAAEAAVLAEQLGGLPLALEQAAAYIAQHDISISLYRERLAEQPSRLYATAAEGMPTDRVVYRVWALTMDSIASRSPLAGNLLEVLAYMGPEALPEDVITPAGDHPLDVYDSLALLASYSMISRVVGMVGVHRLVQAVIRANLSEVRYADDAEPTLLAANRAALLLTTALPSNPESDTEGWPRWNLLLPHVEALTAHFSMLCASPHVVRLVELAAVYLLRQGWVRRAAVLFERLLQEQRQLVGEDHQQTLATMSNLSVAYTKLRDLDKAIALSEHALAALERTIGSDEPMTLRARNNVALAYQEANRIGDAIRLHERNLADRIRLLGEGHPDTLTTRNNLAAAYWEVGRNDDALPLYARNAEDRKHVLGLTHPDALAAQDNLACCYNEAGRVEEAIKLHRHVLSVSEKILGPEHDSTTTTRTNLAAALYKTGRLTEAIALLELNLPIIEKNFDIHHPKAHVDRDCLTRFYFEAERWEDMIPVCERIVEGRERVAGPEHRETLVALSRLAHAYHQTGRRDDAIALYQRVLAEYEIPTSEIEPTKIMTVRNNLASALLSAGQLEKAIEIFEQVLSDSESLHDEENVLVTSVKLSLAYEQNGDAERAIALRERSLLLAERLRDTGDPLTIDIRNRLAHSYTEADMIDKAIPLLEKNLTESERALELDDMITLIRRRNLGIVYERAGRLSDALKIYERNTVETERVLGRDHPNFATALGDLDACEEAICQEGAILPEGQPPTVT